MEKEQEKDFLWELIEYITWKYSYKTELVVGYQANFMPFLMITIPVDEIRIGYISICASDLCDWYKTQGKKKTYAKIDETIENYLRRNHLK